MRTRYDAIRAQWPSLFANPPGAAFEIILDNDDQVEKAERDQEALLVGEGLPGEWGRTGVITEDRYIILVRDAIRRLDGTLGTYDRILPASGSAGVVILPVLDGHIVLIQHFRHATRELHLEVPRGFGEPGVTARQQAKEELYDETGARARDEDLVELGRFHSNNGIASDCVELFIARIDEIGKPQAEEGISGFKICPPREVAELISGAEITDSFTIGAFTRAWLKGFLPGWPSPTES
jgi:ADP-ribose pyrophosphatase